MDREICSICSRATRTPWLLNLAKYDSLDEKARLKLVLCEDCARKLMAAMKTIVKNKKEGIPGNGNGEARLICPICGDERLTTEPKVPAPCEKCGAIFSIYSAARTSV